METREIIAKEPKDIDCDMAKWPARYTVQSAGTAMLIHIEARSAIDVIVAKISETSILGLQENYYISSPNFGVAIPCVPNLQEDYWITEQLIRHEMPAPDAVTVAAVLRDTGNY